MPSTWVRSSFMTGFFSAWHYDGESAVKRTVEIQTIANNFFLLEIERRHGPFAFADLHYVGERDGAEVYGLDEKDGWRLGFSGPVPADLADRLPVKRRYGGWIDRAGIGPAAASFAVVSAAVVAVVLLTPQWLAPLIPASVEQSMGDALVGDFGGRFCHTKAGSAALAKLVRLIDTNPQDLQVEVAKIDMLNAVALPGNKVILFDGLVKTAKSPDEVAGVLAHEIGHVRERHVMQALLRQMGLAVVLGGMDGTGGSLLSGALSMSYTRGSERAADAHSMKALSRASISPVATAAFFDRLAAMSGEGDGKGKLAAVTGYISSHPLSAERKKAFQDSIVKGKDYKPALTHAEWTELKTMCTQDRNAKEGFGLDFE
ncbi:MAG: M48 family metallopeptidase [Sphingorhabdus sp.]